MSDARKANRTPHPYLDKGDDMYDGDDDLSRPGKLGKALRAWSQMSDSYWGENHHAIRVQKRHRRIVMIAVWTGTMAVTLAVIQLLFHDKELLLFASNDWIERWTEFLTICEFLAAMGAAITVLWGLISKMQEEWLLKRHRAERMRMLKYRSLLQFAARGMNEAALQNLSTTCHTDLHRIGDMDEGRLEQWISVNRTWEEAPVPEKEAHSVERADLIEFVEYYRRKRLDAQTRYFDEKAGQAQHRDSITGLIPPLLFVASILCAATHFGIDAFEKYKAKHTESSQTGKIPVPDKESKDTSRRPGAIALVLVVGAACFPVLGSAIRTYRSAYEFSRNSKRFRATHSDLKTIGGRIDDQDRESRFILKELWNAEEALEREHREWLRLMVEAEWYG